jgi:erythromycin esterase-like protein
MTQSGMYNVGQLLREEHAEREGVYVVGFASYEGTVMAGRYWGAEMQTMDVPPASKSIVEYILHSLSPDDRLLLLDDDHWKRLFTEFAGHRAIGVVYHPEQDYGNYVPTLLPRRYDALMYFDKTHALHPMHLKPHGKRMPELYPFGV